MTLAVIIATVVARAVRLASGLVREVRHRVRVAAIAVTTLHVDVELVEQLLAV